MLNRLRSPRRQELSYALTSAAVGSAAGEVGLSKAWGSFGSENAPPESFERDLNRHCLFPQRLELGVATVNGSPVNRLGILVSRRVRTGVSHEAIVQQVRAAVLLCAGDDDWFYAGCQVLELPVVDAG